MSEINIPEKYRSGLTLIAQMTDEITKTLAEVLKTEHPTLWDSDLVGLVVKRVNGIEKDDIENVINSLLWITAGRSIREVPIFELMKDISQSPDLTLSDVERETLVSRGVQFADTKSIGITWKALDVLIEHDKTFHDARIND